MCSYIKISREVLEQFRYKPNVKLVYICLVENAQIKDFQINGKTLHRGDVLMSQNKICEETSLTRQEVRTALLQLIKYQIVTPSNQASNQDLTKQVTKQITKQVTKETPVLTICNYDCCGDFNSPSNQANNQASNQASNHNLTKQSTIKEEIIINNKYNNTPLFVNSKEFTHCPPVNSGEQEKKCEYENLIFSDSATENKTSLNTEKEKEKKYTAPAKKEKEKFSKPTIEEIAEYCNERQNGIDAESFWHFYESKNWFVGKSKMKNWKSAVITWEKSKKNNYNNGNFTANYTDFRKHIDPNTDYGQSDVIG